MCDGYDLASVCDCSSVGFTMTALPDDCYVISVVLSALYIVLSGSLTGDCVRSVSVSEC